MTAHELSSCIKGRAKEKLFGKYGTAIGAILLAGCITLCLELIDFSFLKLDAMITFAINLAISLIISVFMGLITSGRCFLYLEITCNRDARASDIFYGLKANPDKALLIELFISGIAFLSSLPMQIYSFINPIDFNNPDLTSSTYFFALSIPSIVITVIVSVIYSMAFYLLHDFPNYSVKELLAYSRRIMKGRFWKYIYMRLSFLPLALLSLLSCGIGLLWVLPYLYATDCEFFLDAMQQREK